MVYNWYISLGYKVKMWDKIQVPPIDLPPTSHHLITVICDVCGEEKEFNIDIIIITLKNMVVNIIVQDVQPICPK